MKGIYFSLGFGYLFCVFGIYAFLFNHFVLGVSFLFLAMIDEAILCDVNPPQIMSKRSKMTKKRSRDSREDR